MVMNLYLVSMVSWTKKWTNKAKIRLNKCHHGQSWFIVKKKNASVGLFEHQSSSLHCTFPGTKSKIILQISPKTRPLIYSR